MPRLTFAHVRKSYGPVDVLHDLSFEVDDGEFLVLLGPSGCGKSTLLRALAGLADVSDGTISFDDHVVNEWDVSRRNVAFVFQSYALYPQMTVRQNIAFPLLMARLKPWQHMPLVSGLARRRLMRDPAIAETVDRVAGQLQLTSLLRRRPAKLSGGQRQRVALARSLVREPSMYLLDEPLSNLDASLRTQMRSDLVRLHRNVGKTFVLVTHDQVEALTMATRIVILNKGVVQQIGTPDDIYDRPANTFVATFVGSPPMNLIAGDLLGATGLPGPSAPSEPLENLVLGVRPEQIGLTRDSVPGALSGSVETVERLGAETVAGCRLAVPDGPLVFARVPNGSGWREGDPVFLKVNQAAVSWFSRATGDRRECA